MQITEAMQMRGTSADAAEIRKALDEVAVRLPSTDLGNYLYKWLAEATAILERVDNGLR